jgi:hypothetical protein
MRCRMIQRLLWRHKWQRRVLFGFGLLAFGAQFFLVLHLPLPVALDLINKQTHARAHQRLPHDGASVVWNGMHLSYKEPPTPLPISSVHCVGDNFLPSSAWIYRSCHYQWICYSSEREHFFLTAGKEQRQLESSLQKWNHKYARISSTMNSNFTLLSAIGQTPWWARKHQYAWQPKITEMDIDDEASSSLSLSSYLELPIHVRWIPIMVQPQFMLMTAASTTNTNTNTNPLLLLMEVLLPIYNLAHMFESNKEENIVWGITLLNQDDNVCPPGCLRILQRTLQLLFGDKARLISLNDIKQNHPNPNGNYNSTPICAHHGYAGIGMLTDHGLVRRTKKGQGAGSPPTSRNVGRGPLLYDFTRFCLSQAGVIPVVPSNKSSDAQNKKETFLVTVAIVAPPPAGEGSTEKTQQRLLLLESLVRTLQPATTLNSDLLWTIQPWRYMGGVEKAYLQQVARSSVWICEAAGDAAWLALFLPRGATLILLYDDDDHDQGQSANNVQGGKKKQVERHFKSDLWNHLSYLKVHWLSFQHLVATTNGKPSIILDLILESQEQQDSTSKSDDIVANKPGSTTAKFNGINVRLVSTKDKLSRRQSKVHCVGENSNWDAVNYRSCELEHVCLDISQQPSSFVLLRTSWDQKRNTSTYQLQQPHDVVSTKFDTNVMVGQSVRQGTGSPWFPQAQSSFSSSLEGDYYYYELPQNVSWLPYFAEQPNANNPGHLLWDYFLPFYNLLTMFGLQDKQLLLTNLDQWCVTHAPYPCYNVTTKFLPLLGVDQSSFVNTYNPHLEIIGGAQQRQSNLVCAHHGVTGIGMLTDHGYKVSTSKASIGQQIMQTCL